MQSQLYFGGDVNMDLQKSTNTSPQRILRELVTDGWLQGITLLTRLIDYSATLFNTNFTNLSKLQNFSFKDKWGLSNNADTSRTSIFIHVFSTLQEGELVSPIKMQL